MASSFLVRLQRVGKPAKWQTLNVGINRVFPFVIRKGAPHPNAAKLVAVYLAGPDGRKLIWDETKAGNCYYPGNFEHDILNETLAQGIPVVNQEESELLQFLGSEKNAKLEKKIAEVIAGR